MRLWEILFKDSSTFANGCLLAWDILHLVAFFRSLAFGWKFSMYWYCKCFKLLYEHSYCKIDIFFFFIFGAMPAILPPTKFLLTLAASYVQVTSGIWILEEVYVRVFNDVSETLIYSLLFLISTEWELEIKGPFCFFLWRERWKNLILHFEG